MRLRKLGCISGKSITAASTLQERRLCVLRPVSVRQYSQQGKRGDFDTISSRSEHHFKATVEEKGQTGDVKIRRYKPNRPDPESEKLSSPQAVP